MILTVDIGNSNICFALHEDTVVTPTFFERVSSNRGKSAEAYKKDLELILKLHNVDGKNIKKAILSSVVAPLTNVLEEAIESVLSVSVLKVEHSLNFEFENNTKYPESVGRDILADISGALTQSDAPIITIDMGTATVISIVLPAGAEDSLRHPGEKTKVPTLSGVLIQAGVRTSLDSLASDTSQLPDISLKAPEHVIGRNTEDGMKSGIVFGTASMVDGMIDRIEAEIGMKCHVFATGGLSKFIIPYCSHEITLDPELLMKGLFRISELNES